MDPVEAVAASRGAISERFEQAGRGSSERAQSNDTNDEEAKNGRTARRVSSMRSRSACAKSAAEIVR